MGKLLRHMQSYDGEKTVFITLSEWVRKYGSNPEIGNFITIETHTGTIMEVDLVQANNDVAIVTFKAFKKQIPNTPKKHACREYKSQIHRILTQDILNV